MNHELLKQLTETDKDAIIEQAIKVCKWIERMRMAKSCGLSDVEALKKLIETRSGFSLMEYL